MFGEGRLGREGYVEVMPSEGHGVYFQKVAQWRP